ncbi:hypothetical protein ACE103_22330 [Bradyrhizobium sp. ma5]|uniref:hypothetical protein n=1 Tax=Bradyrhizobium sp. ma5 TaxID=3344828 RepID=UPI0035D5253C
MLAGGREKSCSLDDPEVNPKEVEPTRLDPERMSHLSSHALDSIGISTLGKFLIGYVKNKDNSDGNKQPFHQTLLVIIALAITGGSSVCSDLGFPSAVDRTHLDWIRTTDNRHRSSS